MPGDNKEDEIAEFLKDWKSEDQLDIPAFLRRPLYNQQRVPTTRPAAVDHPTQRRYR